MDLTVQSWFRKLKESDEKLDRISKRISFYAVNPVNADEERIRFFESDDYEPKFRYEKYKEDLDALRDEIAAVRTDDSVVGRILQEIKDNYINKTYMLQSRGDAKAFTKYSRLVYGSPDSVLVEEAKKLMHIKQEKEEQKYSSKEVLKKFRLAFFQYGFPWSVMEKEMVSKAAINGSKKIIYIKKDARFSENFLKRLIVHEIGTHVARADNGEMQPYLFFKRGLPGYLMTEEGLAVLNEELNDCSNNYLRKVYAGRVLAIDYALKHSFRETYNHLREHFSKKVAFRLTLRAKRGVGDAVEHGACTKDINYFKGYLELKKFVKEGGDLSKLYYGKIGIQHIKLIDKLPGLINPAFLPMFRHINYLTQHFSSLIKSMILFPLTPLRTINSRLYDRLIR